MPCSDTAYAEMRLKVVSQMHLFHFIPRELRTKKNRWQNAQKKHNVASIVFDLQEVEVGK